MSSTEQNTVGWFKRWKPTDDWYYLSEEDRHTYLSQREALFRDVQARGARLLGTYKVRGQSSWSRFECWEFPSVDAIVQFTNSLEEIRHYQYFQEENMVGRRYEPVPAADSWVI